MKKRYRFLLIVVLIAVGFYFLWPSIKWYFLTPQADKEVAESSRNQIKVFAQEQADEVVKKLVAMNPDDPAPRGPGATSWPRPRRATRRRRRACRPRGACATSSRPTRDARSVAADVEDHYRSRMFALKDLKNQTLQLGLDLRGGMYVVIRADFAALEKSSGTTLTDAQKEDKMVTALEVLRNRIDQFGLTEPSIRRQGSDQVIVEIPGTADPETVRRFIMGKGLLTFHIADTDALQKVREYQAANPSVLLDAAGNVRDTNVLAVLPKGTVLRGVYQKDAYGLDELKGYTVLQEEVGLSGAEIRDAQVARDPVTGEPTVNFILTTAGRGDLLQAHQRQRQQGARGRPGQQGQGAGHDQRGHPRPGPGDAASRRRRRATSPSCCAPGSLPVPLEIISQQAIGASLGEDAIRQGINASALGLGPRVPVHDRCTTAGRA